MEFRCDRCATLYSTTQAVSERHAYTYRCRVCGHTIFVRAAPPPADTPPPRALVVRGGRGDASGSGRSGVLVAVPALAGSLPPREAAPETLPAALFSGKSVIDPSDLPPPRGGYIDLTLDDDPSPARCAPGPGAAGAVTIPTLTPVPVRRPPVTTTPLPRPRASFRPADGPNRAARGDLTPTAPIPLARAPRGLGAVFGRGGGGRARPAMKLTRLQRLLVAAAVFPVVTTAAIALGVAFAWGSPDRVEPPRAAGSSASPVPGAQPLVAAPPLIPPPVFPEARPAPQQLPPRPPAPVAAPAARPEPRIVREPARVAVRAQPLPRAVRVASAPAPRVKERAMEAVAPAAIPPAMPARSSERVASVASVARPPEREEDPVVPRAGYRHPAPLTPRCVEQGIRLPASWADRLPGSVILRFAVGRGGAADLVQMQPGPDRLPGERVEPEIAEALAAAVRACRFSPGADDQGRPTRMWVVTKVQFAP